MGVFSGAAGILVIVGLFLLVGALGMVVFARGLASGDLRRRDAARAEWQRPAAPTAPDNPAVSRGPRSGPSRVVDLTAAEAPSTIDLTDEAPGGSWTAAAPPKPQKSAPSRGGGTRAAAKPAARRTTAKKTAAPTGSKTAKLRRASE